MNLLARTKPPVLVLIYRDEHEQDPSRLDEFVNVKGLLEFQTLFGGFAIRAGTLLG